MLIKEVTENVVELVEQLNFAEKVERSIDLIEKAYNEFGDGLVVANSLGKDSGAVWRLAKRISPKIRGFIVTTRFKPPETKKFMAEEVSRYPELKVYGNDEEIPDKLFATDPDRCCEILKVEPTRQAVKEMDVACWI
ncbi:MAG: phosphoadenosine phosphosulfate reductase family protein, partial [Planctomycetota bacterium]